MWTEPLTCVFDGFPKRVCFESLHDRQKGAGHSASSDGACLFDRAGRVWCCAIEPGRARTGRHGFLEIIHYFTVHSITWRALPSEFGSWNSVGRLSGGSVAQDIRGVLPVAGGVQPDGKPCAVIRQHDSARPRLGRRGERGQHRQAFGRLRGGFSTKIHMWAAPSSRATSDGTWRTAGG